MLQLLLQITCSSLIAAGLFFLLIDLRTHFDKCFRYFGGALLLLCAMTGIDLWIIPTLRSPEEILYWNRVMYVVGCGFSLFYFWYMAEMTRTVDMRYIRVLGAMAITLCAAFFSDWMLTLRDGRLSPGPLYFLLFLPYMTYCLFSANLIILRKLAKTAAAERRILLIHLVGFILLFACGVADLTANLLLRVETRVSYNAFGAMAFGIMASLIFTERFLVLLRERDAAFAKLESAYRDLEQVSVLKQIGESTAIINHEIKNYMFMISGNAQILAEMENLTQKGKDIVRNIVTSVDRLTVFSDDILKLSRIQVTREKHPINLTELIKGVAEKHYPSRRGSFVFYGLERDHFLFGDWGKLEQVFVNLFNNAFEACQDGSAEIRVRITDANSLLLVSVEDNGVGCGKEQLDCLFKAFYTTKKAQGGTGLGMSITRTIVESHGGKISAYSKNLTTKRGTGLKLIMSFPVYAQSLAEEATRKHPIVLVKEGMDNLPDLIRIFQNVRVNPYIVQGASEIGDLDLPQEALTVLVSARTMASGFPVLSQYPRLCLVSHHERNLHILDYGRGNRAEVFSEEYVVSRLVQKAPPRTRLRERQVHSLAA